MYGLLDAEALLPALAKRSCAVDEALNRLYRIRDVVRDPSRWGSGRNSPVTYEMFTEIWQRSLEPVSVLYRYR